MHPGTKLPAIQGRVLNVYEYKTGQNARGAWSFQNIILDDGSGSLEVNLKGRQVFSEQNVGNTITIEAINDAGKHVGIVVDDFNNKIRAQVGPEAMINILGQTAPVATTATPQNYNPPPAQAQAPAPAYQPPPAQAPVQDNPDFLLIKAANAMVRCVEAAINVRDQVVERGGPTIHEDTVRTIATTLFIKLDRKGVVDSYPYKLPPVKAQANTAPAPQTQVSPVAQQHPPEATYAQATPAPAPQAGPVDPDDVGF